jgi:hypothetical protein
MGNPTDYTSYIKSITKKATMSRVPRITMSLSEIYDSVKCRIHIPVIFRSSVAEEDGLVGYITDCLQGRVMQFPITGLERKASGFSPGSERLIY